MARRRKRKRKRRRNPARGVTKTFGKNMQELLSMDTWKDGAILATGSILTPVVSGITQGIANKWFPAIAANQIAGKIIDLVSAALLSTGAVVITRNANTGRLVLLGGMAGVASDVATETILPMVGLADYLALPLSDFVSLPQVRKAGIADFATASQIGKAGSGTTQGETF